MLKIVFMGTPLFSVPILEALYNKYEVLAVVTQPDKEIGRHHEISISPVKKWALEHQIKILQPIKIRKEYQTILNLQPDIIITAAYGQLIPEILLKTPKYQAINVHGSLLPKYRGGAPIQRAIMNGDLQTGITIMYMVKAMDAGDMIAQRELTIDIDDTGDTLFEKLSYLGRDLLMDSLPSIIDGTNEKIVQNENEVTFAYNIKPEEEKIDFNLHSATIHNMVRALYSNPMAYCEIKNERYKIGKTRISELTHNQIPGTIIKITKKYFTIACGFQTAIDILMIQPSGKKMMNASDFINGGLKKIIKEDLQ